MVGGLGTTAVGTPEQVADEFERWVEEGDVDGFNIVSCPMSITFYPRFMLSPWARPTLSRQALSMM